MLTDQPGLSSSLGREGLALVGSKETGRQKEMYIVWGEPQRREGRTRRVREPGLVKGRPGSGCGGGAEEGSKRGRDCDTGTAGVAGRRQEGPGGPGRRGGKRAQCVSIATPSHPGRACGARRPPLGMRQHQESGGRRARPLGPRARDLPAAPRQVTAERRVRRARPSLALPADPTASPRLLAAANRRRATQPRPEPGRAGPPRSAPAPSAPPRPAPARAAAAGGTRGLPVPWATRRVCRAAPLVSPEASLRDHRADWLAGPVSAAGIGPAVGRVSVACPRPLWGRRWQDGGAGGAPGG